MSRSTRTILVLLFSLVVASVASFVVYRQVQAIPVREVEVRSYPVAVAAKALPMGTLLSATDVKLVSWPQSSPVPGAFSTVESVVNRGLLAGVVENEPLTPTKVADAQAGAGLAPTIPPGMRAVSVKVDEVVGVAGFAVPGARVDLVVALTQQDQNVSRVVVTNVLVLTAGTKYDQDAARDGRPVPATVVTLVVTPEDAERISLAASVGRITLALRNPLDIEPTATRGMRLASLMGAADPPPPSTVPAPRRSIAPPPVKAPAPPAPPAIYSVETIRAAKRTSEVVK
ncbi:MAG: Flp pilus assembly protein CpaB [Acidobacteria bacterium]|nr:Flp pilus assembly protein CpaB [Acidobacteriota bacterium]